MTEIRTRSRLVPDEPPAAKPSTGSPSPNRNRIIAITSVFVLLLGLVAYNYWPSSTPADEQEPMPEPTPQPPQPGQPRPDATPPGQQPIPRDIISG